MRYGYPIRHCSTTVRQRMTSFWCNSIMTNPIITRRKWLFGVCCVGLGIASGCATKTTNLGVIDTEPYPRSANEALTQLKDGNQRFEDGKFRHIHEKSSLRSLLVETQKPFATVVDCSNSRVPPKLIFDMGFGDLFTIRLAGNIIAENVIGSLQYAVAHLNPEFQPVVNA